MQGIKKRINAKTKTTAKIPRINKYGIKLSRMLVEFIPSLQRVPDTPL